MSFVVEEVWKFDMKRIIERLQGLIDSEYLRIYLNLCVSGVYGVLCEQIDDCTRCHSVILSFIHLGTWGTSGMFSSGSRAGFMPIGSTPAGPRHRSTLAEATKQSPGMVFGETLYAVCFSLVLQALMRHRHRLKMTQSSDMLLVP